MTTTMDLDMELDAPEPKGSGPQLEDLPQPILDRITSYVFADDLSCIAATNEENQSRVEVSRFATVSRKWQLAVERLLWAEVHLSVRRLDQLPRLAEALLSQVGSHRAGLIKTIKYEGEVEYEYGETRRWDGECKRWEAYGPLYQLLGIHDKLRPARVLVSFLKGKDNDNLEQECLSASNDYDDDDDDDLFDAAEPQSTSSTDSNESDEMVQFKLDSTCLETSGSLASQKRFLEARKGWPRIVTPPPTLTVSLSCFQQIYGGMLLKSVSSFECFERVNTLTLNLGESLYPWRNRRVAGTYGRNIGKSLWQLNLPTLRHLTIHFQVARDVYGAYSYPGSVCERHDIPQNAESTPTFYPIDERYYEGLHDVNVALNKISRNLETLKITGHSMHNGVTPFHYETGLFSKDEVVIKPRGTDPSTAFYFYKPSPPPSWPNLRTLVLYSDFLCAKSLKDIEKFHGGECIIWPLLTFRLCMFLYRARKGVNSSANPAAAETKAHPTRKKARDVKTQMGFDNTPRCVILDDFLETVTKAMLAMPKLEEIEIYLDRRGPESGAKPFIRFNKKEMLARRKFSLFGEGFERAPDQKGLTVGSRFTAWGLAPLDDFRESYDRTVHSKSLAGSGRAQAVLLNWAKFLWQSVGGAWIEERRKGGKNSEGRENSEIEKWVVDEPRLPCWLITFVDTDGLPELSKHPWSDEWEFRKEIVRCGMDWEMSVCGPLSRDMDLWRGKKACHNKRIKEDERLLFKLERKYVRELRSSLSEREQMRGSKRVRETGEDVDEDEARDSKKRAV